MVLWEITLATAYWLGLRKTYQIALRLQRRLIGPQHPRIREFVQRRTRNVFDVALRVHKEMQKRDLSAGKSLGNYILRFFDRARPSANIRGGSNQNQKMIGQKAFPAASHSTRDESTASSSIAAKPDLKSHDRLLFTQYRHKALFGQALRNRISVGASRMYQSIHETTSAPGVRSFSDAAFASDTPPRSFLTWPLSRGVFRADIAQWMLKNPVRKSTVT